MQAFGVAGLRGERGVQPVRWAQQQCGRSDVPTQITFFQGNRWSHNVYNGPSTFYAWSQGSHDNPVTWAQWTGPVSKGDHCSSAAARQGGSCTGPFGQDAGSTFRPGGR